MTDGSKTQVLSLADDSGPVVLKRGGLSMRVAFNPSGTADVYTNFPVTMHPAANDAVKAKAALQIGDLDDGGVYVGKSATTGEDLHAALVDEPESLPLEQAYEAAEKMRKEPGRENAHIPSPAELNQLYEARGKGAFKDTFNTGASVCDGCYRSSAPGRKCGETRVQWFGDGRQDSVYSYIPLPLRLVW